MGAIRILFRQYFFIDPNTFKQLHASISDYPFRLFQIRIGICNDVIKTIEKCLGCVKEKGKANPLCRKRKS